MHEPEQQFNPEPHTKPQVLQLASSESRSTHEPEQQFKPEAQGELHEPQLFSSV